MIAIDALTLLGFTRSDAESAPPVLWQGPWQARLDGSVGMYSAFAQGGGYQLTIKDVEGEAALEFMCTAWSGEVEVSDGTTSQNFDTYAKEHTVKDLRLPGTGRRTITLRVTGAKNSASLDRQIWIHRLLLREQPTWLHRHCRLTEHLTFVNGDFGAFIVLESDKPISHDIKHYGSWGAQQVALFRQLVEPGTIAIDIGANLGHHTVVLSALVGHSGKVLAFEPQPRLARVLNANLALNACDNVEVHAVALGAVNANAKMYPSGYEGQVWNMGALPVVLSKADAAVDRVALQVQVRKLDDLLGSLAPDFIKSDAQGFDYPALMGGERMLQTHRPMIVAEVAPFFMRNAGLDYLDFYAYLRGLGYLIFDPKELNLLDPLPSWNGDPDQEWDIVAVHEHRQDHLARVARASSKLKTVFVG